MRSSTLKHWLTAALLAVIVAPAVDAIDLFVRSPRDGQVVFGEIDVEIEVLSAAPVAEITITLDGEPAARLTAEPYRTRIDVGQDNRTHTFEITATDIHGESISQRIVTGTLAVNEAIDLELQQLYVTVTRGGDPVLDLDLGAFDVEDDNHRQKLVTFERGDVPLTAVLLVDSSHSMKGEALQSALAGAQAFVTSMAKLDQAKVVVFSDRLLAATPFTGEPEAVSQGLAGVEASGGTAVHDHLYLALKQLDGRQGRQVIVLLSDGIDGESVLDMADVAWKAGRSPSLIYWIRPSSSKNNSHFSIWRDTETSRQEFDRLEQVVRNSGGRIREIDHIGQAPDAFREILRELREQYVLGYYPSLNHNDGAWHEVKVKVRAPGVRVRTRGGYVDDQL